MMEGLELQFVEPKAQAFAEALLRLPASTPVMLAGEGPLAADIMELCAQAGLTIEAHRQLPLQAALARARVLVLTEQDGDRLGDQLLACVDLADVLLLAPVTARHFSRMPVFVVSIPKAGTHLAYQLLQVLGYAPGVEPPAFPEPQTWYCVEYSNSHTVARDFFVDTVRRSVFGNRHHALAQSPVLFVYRHPLDILVSEAHYYHRDGKTLFAAYFDGDDLEARVRRLVDDEWLLGSLRQRVGGFLPWLRFPNVIPASFEELVGEAGGGSAMAQRRLIWSILLKLQVGGCVGSIAAQLFNQDSATFREGKIGSHRSQLPAALVEELHQRCGDVISGFGYPARGDALIPQLAEQFAKRPLRFSSVSFDGLPLAVEFDFMGCNLVRYERRFYAVPLTAGALHVGKLTGEQLARLPSAASLSELKALLQIGGEAYARQLAQLSRAGCLLDGEAKAEEAQWYWKTTESPCLLDEHKGFNLICWRGRYFAIRQTIGAVDLSADVRTLLSRHAAADFIVAQDLESLIQQVESAEALRAAGEAANFLAALSSANARRLDETTAAFSGRLNALEAASADTHQLRGTIAAFSARLDALDAASADMSQLRGAIAALSARLDAFERNFAVRVANCLGRFFGRNR